MDAVPTIEKRSHGKTAGAVYNFDFQTYWNKTNKVLKTSKLKFAVDIKIKTYKKLFLSIFWQQKAIEVNLFLL